MTALSALHATRNGIGLTEDDARDIYQRIVKLRSTRAMSDRQRWACRKELLRLYPNAAEPKKAFTGPYARKLQALWIAGWNLGLISNRNDKALIAFVKRQTGMAHMNWLRDPVDADKAIEALKMWLARAGVEWSVGDHIQGWQRQPGFKIAWAQYRILKPELNFENGFASFIAEAHMTVPGKQVREFKTADWIRVMNRFGVMVRVKVKGGKKES